MSNAIFTFYVSRYAHLLSLNVCFFSLSFLNVATSFFIYGAAIRGTKIRLSKFDALFVGWKFYDNRDPFRENDLCQHVQREFAPTVPVIPFARLTNDRSVIIWKSLAAAISSNKNRRYSNRVIALSNYETRRLRTGF